MQKMKKNRGITLVALVITIIILLILAGIAISQLTNSGLFNSTQTAKQEYSNAQEREDDILKQYENATQGDYVAESSRDTVTLTTDQYNGIISRLDALEANNTQLTTQIQNLQNASIPNNIKVYKASNTTNFETIPLETGDYLCYISGFAYGTINTKPYQYMISIGDNGDNYSAYYFQMVAGENYTYTLTVNPRTASNNKGSLSIRASSQGYHHCVLIKLENGHG